MKIVGTHGNGVTTYTVRVDYQDASGEWFERIVAGKFQSREDAEAWMSAPVDSVEVK